MGKLRSISNQIRLSQSFASLSLRQRDLWHGIIATADDQGRLPGLPAAVRSMVWPYDDVSLDDVESDLSALASKGNIIVYLYEDQQYIQIVNWWVYQRSQWAGSSKYPAPEGWKDRERYHGKGRKIFTKNWNTPGGFFIAIDDDDVNDKDNVNVNPLSESKTTKVDDKGSQFPFDYDFDEPNTLYNELLNAFIVEAKLPLLGDIRPRDNEALAEWVKADCTVEDVEAAVTYSAEHKLTIVSPASIHKGVMIARGNRLREPMKMSTIELLKAEGYEPIS